jgi:protein-tyrosine-phosphatase/DNA-binding transcriptional ArsR family regulator
MSIILRHLRNEFATRDWFLLPCVPPLSHGACAIYALRYASGVQLIEVYQCLCEETRLRILNLLARSPLAVSHIQQVLKLPQVKVSKHLAYLRSHGMIECRRQQNRVIYSLSKTPNPTLDVNLGCLQDCVSEYPVFKADLARFEEIAPALHLETLGVEGMGGSLLAVKRKVLFLCTANSARSIMAEYLLRRDGRGQFDVFSAGAKPSGKVNPYAVSVLREQYGIDAAQARTQSWDDYRDTPMDFVITLCGSAEQTCPTWPSQPIHAHWPVPDPAAATGGELAIYEEFARAAQLIKRRLDFFRSLPFGSLERAHLEAMVRDLGTLQPNLETAKASLARTSNPKIPA